MLFNFSTHIAILYYIDILKGRYEYEKRKADNNQAIKDQLHG